MPFNFPLLLQLYLLLIKGSQSFGCDTSSEVSSVAGKDEYSKSLFGELLLFCFLPCTPFSSDSTLYSLLQKILP